MDEPASPYILSFEQVPNCDPACVGGKALHLAELRLAGLRVPAGFAVTTDAYRAFVETNGLQREVADLAARGEQRPDEFKTAIERLQARLRTEVLPRQVEVAIAQAVSALRASASASANGALPLAIRSSALAEDSAEASFAGQYDTYLNRQTLPEIVEAIKACWSSLWNERAVVYRREAGLPLAHAAMGIVVQAQIPSEVSGVLFTLNPVTGREEEMTIESSWGLGEAIVSGRVTPDHLTVNWLDHVILSRDIADKALMSIPDASGTHEVETPPEKRRQPSLGDAQVLALAELGERIQAHYGEPQDIEWALWRGEFYILQARPLTAVNFTAEYGQWTSANFREVMPGFVSPLSASVSLMYDYPRALSEFMSRLGMIPPGQAATEGRLVFGRAFWRFDLVKQAVAALPGFKERAFDETVGIEPSYEGDGRTTPFNLRTILRGLPILLKLDGEYKRFWKEAEAFEKEFPAEEAKFLSIDLGAISDGKLAEWIRSTLDLHCRTNGIGMTATFLSGQAQDDLRVMIDTLNRVRPAGTEPVVMANLLTSLGSVVTARPIAEIEQLARSAKLAPEVAQTIAESPLEELSERLMQTQAGRSFWAQFQDFCRRFRFLSEVDEDFGMARYDEDATIPLRVLKQNLQDHAPGHRQDMQLLRMQEEARVRELRTLFKRGIVQRLWNSKTRILDVLMLLQLDEQLATVRRYAWWREETRELVARAHYLCHRFFGELGRRWVATGALAEPRDIFLLTRTQILDYLDRPLEGKTEFESHIRRYKRMRQAYRRFEIPWTINVPVHASVESKGDQVLRGVPCSAGRVTGPVRIIHDPTEGYRLKQGEILVAPYTNPNWTPLFSLASAIIMEEGGLLSHGAVIAREAGIPAVLQIKRATQRLHDGQQVCVDGTHGLVEILAE